MVITIWLEPRSKSLSDDRSVVLNRKIKILLRTENRIVYGASSSANADTAIIHA